MQEIDNDFPGQEQKGKETFKQQTLDYLQCIIVWTLMKNMEKSDVIKPNHFLILWKFSEVFPFNCANLWLMKNWCNNMAFASASLNT